MLACILRLLPALSYAKKGEMVKNREMEIMFLTDSTMQAKSVALDLSSEEFCYSNVC